MKDDSLILLNAEIVWKQEKWHIFYKINKIFLFLHSIISRPATNKKEDYKIIKVN
jgi:hypothetical protein